MTTVALPSRELRALRGAGMREKTRTPSPRPRFADVELDGGGVKPKARAWVANLCQGAMPSASDDRPDRRDR